MIIGSFGEILMTGISKDFEFFTEIEPSEMKNL